MSDQTIKIIITIAIVLHALAHGRAFLSLIRDALGSGTAKTIPVRFGLAPSLSRKAAASLASVFWFLATLGFFAAAWMFWSGAQPEEAWRQIAIAAAIISTLGSLLFSGIWPGAPTKQLSTLDTVISLVFNAAILIALVLLKWPPA